MTNAGTKIVVQFVLPGVAEHRLGGMEKVAAFLLNGLDQDRFSGSLVCFDPKNGALNCIDSAKVDARVIEKKEGIDPTLIFRLRQHFKKTRPDLVHTFNEGALIYGFPAARLASVPALVHAEHGRLPISESTSLRIARTMMMRRADHVIVVSNSLREVLHDEGVSDAKISTIINGVDLAPFKTERDKAMLRRQFGLVESDWVVGTVGSLTPQKNQELLIRAAARVPGIKVLIAGAGPLEKSLNSLIDSLKESDRMTCVGKLSDVPAFLCALDLFVLPSNTEGTSLALLEAMAARLPVIATDVGGNPDVVEGGITGLLTPSEDVSAMAEKIAACAADRAGSAAMGRNGRTRVQEKYAFAETVSAYENIFEQVVYSNQLLSDDRT